ncbi:MAG: right-handed parallel beta-helix repeat-containing protein [Planctomycetes bacterium]|nr:right-handed parallel beta-helix repeat-containing protein [Planctomycetota bacterium]
MRPGVYEIVEPLDVNRWHDPADPDRPAVKNLVVRAEGEAADTVVRMSETPVDPFRAPVVIFENGETADCVLEGFTLTGGMCSGVQSIASSPTLVNCVLRGNRSWHDGGGFTCQGGSPCLVGCTIAENRSGIGGGVFSLVGSSLSLIHCVIRGNLADYGGGIAGQHPDAITLRHCTVTENSGLHGGGLYCNMSLLEMTSCIVWGNEGGSLAFERTPSTNITFSCVEGETVWPGTGNTNDDPCFCGWAGPEAVYVDAIAPGPGSGTVEDPFLDLAAALAGFSLALSPASPCIGTGDGGSDMGADVGTCATPGTSTRVVHVAAGTYRLAGVNLSPGVSLLGAGADQTTIEGTVFGLADGQVLCEVTVAGGEYSGLRMLLPGIPEVARCTITGNRCHEEGGGVAVRYASPVFTDCVITENLADEGGGIFCREGSATLTRCTIARNRGDDGTGAGVFLWGSSATLTDCRIVHNRITDEGDGGGFALIGASLTLAHCAVLGNLALDAGGGALREGRVADRGEPLHHRGESSVGWRRRLLRLRQQHALPGRQHHLRKPSGRDLDLDGPGAGGRRFPLLYRRRRRVAGGGQHPRGSTVLPRRVLESW